LGELCTPQGGGTFVPLIYIGGIIPLICQYLKSAFFIFFSAENKNMEVKGWTLEELAEKLGISKHSL
jgi:hypothetical protein